MTENEILRQVVAIFEAGGRRVFHSSDSRKQVRNRDWGYRLVGDDLARGYPDLTIAGCSKDTIWAELKGPDGRLEPEQVEWMDDLPAHRAYVWGEQDLDVAAQVQFSGHPPDGRTCWTCRRGEIIGRFGIRGQPGTRKRQTRNNRKAGQ